MSYEESRVSASWQLIDSAPKDGTRILVASSYTTELCVVFWGNHAEECGDIPALPENSVIERGWCLANSEYGYPCHEPTCWMPIPIPDSKLREIVESLFFAHAYNDHVSVGSRIDELCRLLSCGHYGSDDP